MTYSKMIYARRKGPDSSLVGSSVHRLRSHDDQVGEEDEEDTGIHTSMSPFSSEPFTEVGQDDEGEEELKLAEVFLPFLLSETEFVV